MPGELILIVDDIVAAGLVVFILRNPSQARLAQVNLTLQMGGLP